ncbi:MAG TPA: hypothetical protein VNB94_03125 [Mycobacteriales bacterium]|nr:hypothetical protein [Mycobacteriales bacterium]
MRAGVVLQVVTAVLCLLQGGYMVVDGVRALMVGSYITPSSGDYAGQLGPWAPVVSALGIDPYSSGMKLTFVALGAAWLVAAFGVTAGAHWAWRLGRTVAVLSLWYLIPGTVIAVLVILLLMTPQVQQVLGRG